MLSKFFATATVTLLLLVPTASAADFSAFGIPVTCTSMAGAPVWAEGVYRDDKTIELRQPLCTAIDRAIARNMRNAGEIRSAAFAVFTLAHELSHSLGTHDSGVSVSGEDSTEPDCVAWMLYSWVAMRLGLNPQTTARLMAVVRARGTQSCQAWQQTR
jgi:hypothetical protein